jgi:hypothetical protein
MNSDEAEMPQRPERKTLELCGDQPQQGMSCILRRGHDGDHACQTEGGIARVWWRRSR